MELVKINIMNLERKEALKTVLSAFFSLNVNIIIFLKMFSVKVMKIFFSF